MNPMQIKNIDFAKYLEDLSFTEAPSIRSALSFSDDVSEYAADGQKMNGASLPWTKTQNIIRLGLGKLSIWAGESGSGKSLMLGQVITSTLLQGRQAVIASLEMSPRETLYRMICQSSTCKASRDYCMRWLNNFDSKLWIYDELDRVDATRILGMCHYAAHELGVKDIVIDSLTKCGVGRDDYSEQAKFVDKLQWCAKTWNVHIHLVCHMRKGGEGHKSGKNDIRGAAEITDLADNVFIVSRNKKKEVEAEKRELNRDYDQAVADQPCAYLEVAKNREFGIETNFGLYFNRESGVYLGSAGSPLCPLGV